MVMVHMAMPLLRDVHQIVAQRKLLRRQTRALIAQHEGRWTWSVDDWQEGWLEGR